MEEERKEERDFFKRETFSYALRFLSCTSFYSFFNTPADFNCVVQYEPEGYYIITTDHS